MTGVLHTYDEAVEASPVAPLEITLEEAKELLLRAVNDKGGDYVYQRVTLDPEDDFFYEGHCAYFDPATGAPSCIVGHVLSYKGLTFEALEKVGRNVYADVLHLSYDGIIVADSSTLALLSIAQGEQDLGQTWAEAMNEALATYTGRAEGYEEQGY